MKQQGLKRGTTATSLRKMILAHPESFQHFSRSMSGPAKYFLRR